MPDVTPIGGADRVPPLSARLQGYYGFASVGAGFFYAFNTAVLPLLIPSNNVLLVNLMSNTRSIEGTLIQPLVGACSDRLWTPLGRRRVFMLGAMPLCALCMALTPLAPNLATIVLCIVLFSLFFNVALDPYTALLADIAPPAQRPRLNALATVLQFVGQIGLLFVLAYGPFGKHLPALVYPLVGVAVLSTVLVTVVGVPERRELAHLEPRRPLGQYLAALHAHRPALRYLVALFLYNAGLNTVFVNLTRFATHVLGASDAEALKLFLFLVVVTGVLTIPAARIAGRVGIKRMVMLGMGMIGLSAAGAFVVRTPLQAVPVLAVAGCGYSCLTLSWPLLTLLIPPERVGVFAGLMTAAQSLSAFASSFVAAAMVGAWGYRSIFLVVLLAVAASLWTLTAVEVPGHRPVADGLRDP